MINWGGGCSVQSKRKGSKASYDLWDTEDFGANNEDVIAASAKKPRVSKKMAGIKPLNAVPAIEVRSEIVSNSFNVHGVRDSAWLARLPACWVG